MMTVDQVLTEVERMSEADRGLLMDRLSERMWLADPEIEAAWSAEIQRRVGELESGQVRALPLEETLAKGRKLVGL